METPINGGQKTTENNTENLKNEKKQYILTTMNFRKILPYQTEIFRYKAKFIRKILNLLVIS